MSLPIPPVALDGVCSAIYENTLYTYSADAFQALPLSKNASWSQLPMGVSVSGAACVLATPKDASTPTALYIVGGTANSSMSDYQGLQRYDFAKKAWESITPVTAVTQNRQYHSAVYINSTSSIFVYAGSQNGNADLSSQTFSIETSPPYNVLAYESTAPPAVKPLLLQWSESQAAMIGGSTTNTDVMLFDVANGWMNSNATLSAPLNTAKNVQALIVKGDDDSMNLYTFDMSVSPNQVNRTVLIDANQTAVQNAKPVTKRDLDLLEADVVKRDLTQSDWPAYNDTLAPTTTRDSYSLASGPDGLVVVSGGSATDPLCIFNAMENKWDNATEMLVSHSSQAILGSPTTSPSSSATATATSTSTASSSAAASSGSHGSSLSMTALGAVLGSVLGAGALLVIALLVLRWHRKKKLHEEAGHERRASGNSDGEKETAEFNALYTGPIRAPRHEPSASQGSFSSMAILMGNIGHKRGGSNGSKSSSMFKKNYKNAISNPKPVESARPTTGWFEDPPSQGFSQRPYLPTTKEESYMSEKHIEAGLEPVVPPAAAGAAASSTGKKEGTRRSSGWNRYWSGEALGLGGSRRNTNGSDRDSRRSSNSHYSDSRLPSQITQKSAVPPPLNFDRPPSFFNRVQSGSPTLTHTSRSLNLPTGLSGQIERPDSSSTISTFLDDDKRDAFSSGVPESVHEPMNHWDPTSLAAPWEKPRVASSAYSDSNYGTRDTQDMRDMSMSHFPIPPSTRDGRETPAEEFSWLDLGDGPNPKI